MTLVSEAEANIYREFARPGGSVPLPTVLISIISSRRRQKPSRRVFSPAPSIIGRILTRFVGSVHTSGPRCFGAVPRHGCGSWVEPRSPPSAAWARFRASRRSARSRTCVPTWPVPPWPSLRSVLPAACKTRCSKRGAGQAGGGVAAGPGGLARRGRRPPPGRCRLGRLGGCRGRLPRRSAMAAAAGQRRPPRCRKPAPIAGSVAWHRLTPSSAWRRPTPPSRNRLFSRGPAARECRFASPDPHAAGRR